MSDAIPHVLFGAAVFLAIVAARASGFSQGLREQESHERRRLLRLAATFDDAEMPDVARLLRAVAAGHAPPSLLLLWQRTDAVRRFLAHKTTEHSPN